MVRRSVLLLLVLARISCVCKSQSSDAKMLEQLSALPLPARPTLSQPSFTWLLHSSNDTVSQHILLQSFAVKKHFLLSPLYQLCQLLSLPVYRILLNAHCQNRSHFVSFEGHPLNGASCMQQPGSFISYISSQGLF